MQPVPVAGTIATALVSNTWLAVSPTAAVVAAVLISLKVTLATLTTPFGESRPALCKAETFVVPGVAVLVVGGLENSAVLPPATEAIVTTLGSKVIVSEYAPSGVVLTSTVSSAVNCCPARTTLGQLNVAWAA